MTECLYQNVYAGAGAGAAAQCTVVCSFSLFDQQIRRIQTNVMLQLDCSSQYTAKWYITNKSMKMNGTKTYDFIYIRTYITNIDTKRNAARIKKQNII